MASSFLRAKVIQPISMAELERRWKAVREVMKEKHIDFLVERPFFQPGETMKIKTGMNIAPHPAISKKGTAGICDNYIVTETGVSECLHKMPKNIFLV